MIHRRKTLRTYSVAIDLRKIDPALWITREGFCEEMVDMLTDARHYELLPPGMASGELRPIDLIVKRAASLREYPR